MWPVIFREMARLLVFIIFISLFVVFKCDDTTDQGDATENSEDGKDILNEIGEMDDDQLWNLLKEASRNTSRPLDNTVYDYGDYEELEESEVTTENLDGASVDTLSSTDSTSGEPVSEDAGSTIFDETSSPTEVSSYTSLADDDVSPSSVTTEAEVAASDNDFISKSSTEPVKGSSPSEDMTESSSKSQDVSSTSEQTTESTAESESAVSSEFTTESTTESVSAFSSEHTTESTAESVSAVSSDYSTESTAESVSAVTSEYATESTDESVSAVSSEYTTESTAESVSAVSSKYTTESTAELVSAVSSGFTTESTDESVSSVSSVNWTESTTELQGVTSISLSTTESTAEPQEVSSSTQSVTESTTEIVEVSSSKAHMTGGTTQSEIHSTFESTTESEVTSSSDYTFSTENTASKITKTPSSNETSSEPTSELQDIHYKSTTDLYTTASESSIIDEAISKKIDTAVTSLSTVAITTVTDGLTSTSQSTTRESSSPTTDDSTEKVTTKTQGTEEFPSTITTTTEGTSPTSRSIIETTIPGPSANNVSGSTTERDGLSTKPTTFTSTVLLQESTIEKVTPTTRRKTEESYSTSSTTYITTESPATTIITPVINASMPLTTPVTLSKTSQPTTKSLTKSPDIIVKATKLPEKEKISTSTTATTLREEEITTTIKNQGVASTLTTEGSKIEQKSSSPTTTEKNKLKPVLPTTVTQIVTTSEKPTPPTTEKPTPPTTEKIVPTKARTTTVQKPSPTPPSQPTTTKPPKRTTTTIKLTTKTKKVPVTTALPTTTRKTAKTTTTKRKHIPRRKVTPKSKPATTATTPRTTKPATTPRTTKPALPTILTTFLPKKNITEKPTVRSKVNKFDPNRISIIDEDPEKPPISVTNQTSCKNNNCSPTKKINVFDSSKIFMIDHITEPPVVFKKKFDPSRKFAVDDDKPPTDPISTKQNKNIQPLPKLPSQPPVLKPSIFISSAVTETPVHSIRTGNTFDQNQDFNNVPEVLCFNMNNVDGKNALQCFTVNSKTRTFSAPFLVNIRQRNQYTNPEYSPPPIRRIFIRNRNYQGPAMIMNSRPNFHIHQIKGNILHTSRDGKDFPHKFRISLKTPTNRILLSNNPPQQSLIGIGRDMQFRTAQAIPGCCGQSAKESRPEQLNYRVLIRHPRSTVSRCNPDDTIYEDEGHTLAFVFDNTGSMHDELEQMRKTAIEITTQMTGKKRNLIKDYVLVTFNDPGVSEPFCTSDYTDFLGKLEKISIRGGGDCPEMCLTGLQKALTVSRPGSFIFVITDAYAKDYYLEEKILKLIMRKTPSIFYLITGRCSDYPDEGFDVFRNISTASNGQIIDMAKTGVKQMLDELNDKYVRQDLVTLTKIVNNNPAETPYPVDVPVDSSISNITFSVTGKDAQLDVTNPKGDKPPGEYKGFRNIKIIHYQEPMPGVWKAMVGSSSAHSFSTVGVSSTNFKVGFSVLPAKKISETSHRPLKGGENYIFVEVSNPEGVEEINYIELVNLSGKSVNKINLKKIITSNKETLYSGGPFVPPDELFNMEMNGIGRGGEPIKRISPSAIVPQLPEQPYITMLSRMGVEAGQSIALKCHVESLVPVTVKMYKKSPSSHVVNYNFKQSGDGLFEIKNVSVSDEGTYTCWAKNVAGDQQKDIVVAVTVRPPTITVKEEILFTADQRVVIPCSIKSSADYSVSWKRGGDGDFYFVHENSRTHVTDAGLIIEKAQESDKGWYQCTAKNLGGEAEGVTYLKLSLLPEIEISANQKYLADFNISLTCTAYGVPTPEVFWRQNGVQLSAESHGRMRVSYFPKYGEIRINGAQQDDEGAYTCVAKNFAGEVTKDTFLIYQEKPKITANTVKTQVKAGEDISMTCHVTGLPTPRLEWTKDSLSISTELLPNAKILSDNSLLIRPSSIIHSGLYKCRAQNEFGFDEITIPVEVIGTSPQIIEPPEDIAIEIGMNGKLTCEATGHPEPKISWSRSYGKDISGVQDENSLEIYNASLSDKGEYWCVAENTIGRAESQAFVDITGGVMPVVSKEKNIEITKVLPGEKAKLDCSVMGGNPRPEIEWFKDGTKLVRRSSNGIKLENGSYFISSVNPSDVGLYECVASNYLGTDVKKIELKLYEPPKIDMNSSTNVIATVGNSARLTCPVTGDPVPKVSWKRHIHSYYKTIRGVVDESNDLVFEKVLEEDTGRYICTAENIVGTARRPFALHVMIPPKIGPWPVEMFVESGNILTLECRVRAIPRPSIFWLKNNETISKSKYYGQFLRFYTKPEDSGTYTCIAENRAGKDKVETNLIVLVPPQIQPGSSIIKVISGNNAILPCEVSGNPKPSVAWQSNGELIKKEFRSESGTLHLYNVTEADAGTYICTAQNKAGINKKKLELLVLTPPRVLPWTEPIKAIIGELVNITCQHFANPEATINWYKDKQPMPSMKDKNRIEFVVKPHHKGVYTCEAVNEAGSDSKDFLLVILDPPTFAQEQPFSIEVLRGKSVEIPCIAFGDPKPTMGWNRTDVILDSNSKRIVNTDTGLLTLINVSPEDEGYYNCTAKNRAGYIWRTIELNVLELPSANLTISSNIVKEGDVVEFTCNVKGKPQPKIYWKKDGKVLSMENDKKLRLIAYYKDQGNYTCIVKNSAGEVFSSVELNVSVLPSIDGPKEERLVVLEGEEILLKCFGGGMPLPNIKWTFNGTDREKKLFSEEVDGPELRIEKATQENDGVYMCIRSNFAGSAEKQFKVYVYVKPSIIDHFDTQMTLIEGKDLSLPCNAEGIPKPMISWMKESVKLNPKNSLVSSPSVHDNFLLIFNAKNTSGGNYTCYATNDAGVAKRTYEIQVEALKLPVKEGIRMMEFYEGQDGELNCEAKPGSEINWLKDQQTLKLALERSDDGHYTVNGGGSILKITEAFPGDSGLYTCIATHPEEEEMTRLFSVSVLVTPHFLDTFPTTEFTVRENDSLTLQCPAQGTPIPVINWRLAESNLPINEHTLPGVNIHGTNENSLLIKSAKPFHTGLYLCSAVNKLGEERRIFNVKVIGPPKRNGPELIEIDIVSGSSLELNCSIDGSPDPLYNWSFESRIEGKDKVLKYTSKTIRIGNAQAEDDGIYTCSASNLFGNSSKVFNVSVIEIPRIKRELEGGKVMLAEGEDCSLKCICAGRKPMDVKWFFNGTQINSSAAMAINFLNASQIEYTYTISNVSKEYQGTYSCNLSNIAGSDEHHIEVEVIAPPKFSKPPKNEKLDLMEGAPIHLECPVESIDNFKIQWKKNGILIPEKENRTFHIEESTIMDDGNYTCIASNYAGRLATKFQVNVLAEPKMLSSTNDTFQKISLDGKLTLNCTARGNPRPQILWTKNMELINDLLLPQIIFSGEDQILEIDEVDSSDAGKYSCFPSNTVGSVEKHFEVEVIEPPLIEGKEAIQEKKMMTDVYRRAVLRCPITGSPEPKISWFKDSEEINEIDQRFRISPDRKLLIINHAEETTAGRYACSGKNEVGDNKFIFSLHIKIPMQWSQWSAWHECNVSCGGGMQLRKRDCMGDRNEILSEYIHLYNSSCIGADMEYRECNDHICPINGGWGMWAEWGPCSSSCGQGIRRRSRRCNNPVPSHGGEDCVGETYEDAKCEELPCPVNGEWGEWSDWNECSATCGPSIKMRTRRCNSPPPAYGGLPCSGNSRDIALCKIKDCPSDVEGWSSWSRWSQCTVSCGTGKQVRTRTCYARYGTECKGEKYQVRACKKAPCTLRRYPRHATLKIHGELNNQQIDENIEAKIIQKINETLIEAISKNISNKDALSYLPFIMSPMSWYTAEENEKGKNGQSLANGNFQENSTYHFSTGEEMEVQSDAQSISNDEDLKLDIKVQGRTPVSPAATIIINPYTEELIQTDSHHVKSSSATKLDADGTVIPVSWTKTLSFPGREGSQIYPVEALTAKGSKSHFDRERNQLEYRANPMVVSTKFLRNGCPTGFKYDSDTGECSDINECRRRVLNNCLPSQICINNLGSYTCECRQGFRKSPSYASCKDINECLEGLHLCSHKCQNTRGSYQCLCPKHLILAEDMHNCVEGSDYDDYYGDSIEYLEGSSSTILKSQIALPIRKAKSLFTSMDLEPVQKDGTGESDYFQMSKEKNIVCEDGFQRVGDECEDINECTDIENSCTREQLCMNTPGSFVCIEAPCPDHFILSTETRSCVLLCLEEEEACTDGALLSESLQIITVPVYKGNYTFHPFTDILEMTSYDNNELPLSGSVYEIVQNEAGLPVKIKNENRIGVLYAVKYFEVSKSEKLILMSSKYDSNGSKLHSTMFVVIIYNIKSAPM